MSILNFPSNSRTPYEIVTSKYPCTWKMEKLKCFQYTLQGSHIHRIVSKTMAIHMYVEQYDYRLIFLLQRSPKRMHVTIVTSTSTSWRLWRHLVTLTVYGRVWNNFYLFLFSAWDSTTHGGAVWTRHSKHQQITVVISHFERIIFLQQLKIVRSHEKLMPKLLACIYNVQCKYWMFSVHCSTIKLRTFETNKKKLNRKMHNSFALRN